MCECFLFRAWLVLVFVSWTANSDGAVSAIANVSDFSAPEGSRIRINCSLTAETVTGWFDSNGQKINGNPSQRLHVTTQGDVQFLEIDKLNRSDGGQYECRGAQSRVRVMLYVEYSPVFSRKRSTSKTIYSSIDSNREITLNCVFEGYPVPRVRFKRMGVELNNSGISYEAGSASYNFFVKSENDFGFYTCEATNDRGSAYHFIEVYKPGPPEPPNNIRVFPSCDKIDVTWDPAVKDGGSKVLGYNIELWRGERTVKSANLSVLSRKGSFLDVESKTLYEVRMNSRNVYGDGEWRTLAVNTTLACFSEALSCACGLSLIFSWAWILPAHIIL